MCVYIVRERNRVFATTRREGWVVSSVNFSRRLFMYVRGPRWSYYYLIILWVHEALGRPNACFTECCAHARVAGEIVSVAFAVLLW